ncbi:MAG: L-histidine N(alpha)-methyltransferase [Candidatus Eremiobacteraeota bacterium]|nr:L-histidine N(alpha)-methyltransferase [Candidatus Eremiobacteraeota bacterium]
MTLDEYSNSPLSGGAKYLQQQGVPCTYLPVDISTAFLEIAARAMAPFVARICPIHATFETCSGRIPSSAYEHTAYCMIGLTFMNFMPDRILPLLKEISRDQGR